MCIKSEFRKICLKLATNGFLLTSKVCPQGVFCPCPGVIYMYKIIKNVYKIRFRRDHFETCNLFLLHFQIVYPKTDEQRKRLSEAVKPIFIFRSLEPVSTEMILSFQTDRPGKTVKTQIRQSDHGLHCLPFDLLKPPCSNFRIITASFFSDSLGFLQWLIAVWGAWGGARD